MLVTDFLRRILLSLSFVSSICAVSAAAAPRRLPKVYGVLLYDYFTTLDVMGPLSYFNNLPDVEVFFIHNSVNATPSGNVTSFDDVYVGQFYKSVYTLDNAPPLDVLVVPGSFTGTGPGIKQGIWAEYIKKVYPSVQYIFSVCTGSGFVAASGILDGRRATTNKGAYKFIKTLGPKVRWVPEARWVVDGNIWTSSGVQAGTDMANAFVTYLYGKHMAQSISNIIEYSPITNSSWDPFAAIDNVTANAVVVPENVGSSFTRWGVLAYPGFIALDVVSIGTYAEFVVMEPGYFGNMSLIAPTLDDVKMSSVVPAGGQSIVPTHHISNPPSNLDVLIVPGLPTAGPFPHEKELVEYIRTVYPSLKHIISVGTGSMLLASAGILEGRNATTSKSLFHAATKPYRKGHKINWTGGRWVQDGNVWTTSSSATGLDSGNALAIALFGKKATLWASTLMEYLPSSDPSYDPFAHLMR